MYCDLIRIVLIFSVAQYKKSYIRVHSLTNREESRIRPKYESFMTIGIFLIHFVTGVVCCD